MDSQEDSQPSQSSVMTLMDDNRHEVLYFAYGSNLSTAQMLQRCPYATPVGLGRLTGWYWIINERGFANIVQLPTEDGSPTLTTRAESSQTQQQQQQQQQQQPQPQLPRQASDVSSGAVGAGAGAGSATVAGSQGGGDEKDEDACVYGLLYLLPQEDEERLDVYEGVPWAYQKYHADLQRVRDENGREVDETVRVLVYVDAERVTPDVPRDEYIDRMERGIQDAVENWGMSEEYANRTMRRFWSY